MANRKQSEDLERVQISTPGELDDWLSQHHAQTQSIWVVRWLKHKGPLYVSVEQIIDVCLCWGWIDSLPRKLDADRTMLRISPRNPKSAWSGVNKRNIARLEAEGRMRAPGWAVIETAKSNGAWAFLDDVERLERPDDLVSALAERPGARDGFDALSPSNQRGILEWLKRAKTAPTRQKRLQQTVDAAVEGRNPLS